MHDPELQGAKPRDHAHPRRHGRPDGDRRLHQDWRVWAAVVLMLALILVYVFSDDLRFRGGGRTGPQTPAVNGP